MGGERLRLGRGGVAGASRCVFAWRVGRDTARGAGRPDE